MKIPIREWVVEAPWGNLSLTSWGNTDGLPVFMAHGRQDCAATFQPLLELMPRDDYHYVGIDMPGSGSSTHLPVGAIREHMSGISNNTSMNASEDNQEAVETMDIVNENATQNTVTDVEFPKQMLPDVSTSDLVCQLTTHYVPNLINQDEAAQAMNICSDIEDPSTSNNIIDIKEVMTTDIAPTSEQIDGELKSDAGYVVIEMEDLAANTINTDDKSGPPQAFRHIITEVDPNGNLPYFANRNLNIVRVEVTPGPIDLLNNEETEKFEKEQILDSINVLYLKAGDEIYSEETRYAYKILFAASCESYCAKIFTTSENIARDHMRYKLVKNSDIKFVPLDQNMAMLHEMNTPKDISDLENKASDLLLTEPPEMTGVESAVPSNSPEDIDAENMLSKLEKLADDIELSTKIFQKLSLPTENPGRKNNEYQNADDQAHVFPKYIKCNDHGVGGTCPFESEKSSFVPIKRSKTPINLHSAIEVPPLYNQALSDEVAGIYPLPELHVNLPKPDYNTNETSFYQQETQTGKKKSKIDTKLDAAHDSLPNEGNNGSKKPGYRTQSKHRPETLYLRETPNFIRNCNMHKEFADTYFCLCMGGSYERPRPFNWITNCFNCCFPCRNKQQRSPNLFDPAYASMNLYMNNTECPLLGVSLPASNLVPPFCPLPLAFSYEFRPNTQRKHEAIYQEYVTPRPNEEDGEVLLDEYILIDGPPDLHVDAEMRGTRPRDQNGVDGQEEQVPQLVATLSKLKPVKPEDDEQLPDLRMPKPQPARPRGPKSKGFRRNHKH